jgi:hypothetical protein
MKVEQLENLSEYARKRIKKIFKYLTYNEQEDRYDDYEESIVWTMDGTEPVQYLKIIDQTKIEVASGFDDKDYCDRNTTSNEWSGLHLIRRID